LPLLSVFTLINGNKFSYNVNWNFKYFIDNNKNWNCQNCAQVKICARKQRDNTVACCPTAKQWLCKQCLLLGNGCKEQQRNSVLYMVWVIATCCNNRTAGRDYIRSE
jgi:hypothetical protein